MARRDRVPLDTPIPVPTLKGWRIDPIVKVNIEDLTMSGSISYYDTTGAWIRSERFENIQGVNGDLNLASNKVENLADAIATKLINKAPQLAGTRIVEVVPSSDTPVPNP